jgi:hypothetical protein
MEYALHVPCGRSTFAATLEFLRPQHMGVGQFAAYPVPAEEYVQKGSF